MAVTFPDIFVTLAQYSVGQRSTVGLSVFVIEPFHDVGCTNVIFGSGVAAVCPLWSFPALAGHGSVILLDCLS